jgi:hypothetical protein
MAEAEAPEVEVEALQGRLLCRRVRWNANFGAGWDRNVQ